MICVDTTSVFGGIKTKSLELTFLIFKKSGAFLLKFNIVPTLCDKFSFIVRHEYGIFSMDLEVRYKVFFLMDSCREDIAIHDSG